MRPEDYTIEDCPFCGEYVAIRSTGITACPECGKPVIPCSCCPLKRGCDYSKCPYGCTGDFLDEKLPVTNLPMTPEEIAFAEEGEER